MLSGRGRRTVTCHHIHEIVDAKLAEVVEDDGTKTGNQADDHEVKRPFAGMGQIESPVLAGQPVDPRFYGRIGLHRIWANSQYPNDRIINVQVQTAN